MWHNENILAHATIDTHTHTHIERCEKKRREEKKAESYFKSGQNQAKTSIAKSINIKPRTYNCRIHKNICLGCSLNELRTFAWIIRTKSIFSTNIELIYTCFELAIAAPQTTEKNANIHRVFIENYSVCRKYQWIFPDFDLFLIETIGPYV